MLTDFPVAFLRKPILTLPPVETAVIDVTLSQAEREFYNALLRKSQDVFDGFIRQGTASKSWLAIFSLLHRLRMSCDHIALTVKAHMDEDEWNAASSVSGNDQDGNNTSSAASNDSVDDNVRGSYRRSLFRRFYSRLANITFPRVSLHSS